jgi:DNA processing protein
MNKKIYTLPHRINESLGTQELVKKGLVEPIYDIDEFISQVTNTNKIEKTTDELLLFCESNPSYEEAVLKFGNRVFEYELEGKIAINNAKVSVI